MFSITRQLFNKAPQQKSRILFDSYVGDIPMWRRYLSQWGGVLFFSFFTGGAFIVRWKQDREMEKLMEDDLEPEWEQFERRRKVT